MVTLPGYAPAFRRQRGRVWPSETPAPADALPTGPNTRQLISLKGFEYPGGTIPRDNGEFNLHPWDAIYGGTNFLHPLNDSSGKSYELNAVSAHTWSHTMDLNLSVPGRNTLFESWINLDPSTPVKQSFFNFDSYGNDCALDITYNVGSGWQIRLFDALNNLAASTLAGTTVTGAWQHVRVEITNTTMYLILDGVEVAAELIVAPAGLDFGLTRFQVAANGSTITGSFVNTLMLQDYNGLAPRAVPTVTYADPEYAAFPEYPTKNQERLYISGNDPRTTNDNLVLDESLWHRDIQNKGADMDFTSSLSKFGDGFIQISALGGLLVNTDATNRLGVPDEDFVISLFLNQAPVGPGTEYLFRMDSTGGHSIHCYIENTGAGFGAVHVDVFADGGGVSFFGVVPQAVHDTGALINIKLENIDGTWKLYIDGHEKLSFSPANVTQEWATLAIGNSNTGVGPGTDEFGGRLQEFVIMQNIPELGVGVHAVPHKKALMPRAIPELVGWYDADKALTIANSGGVSAMEDITNFSHDLAQGVVGNRPAVVADAGSGRNVIDFTAANDHFLERPGDDVRYNFDDDGGVTVFAVMAHDAYNDQGGNYNHLFGKGELGDITTPSLTSWGFGIQFQNPSTDYAFLGSNQRNYNNETVDDDTLRLYAARTKYDTPDSVLNVNGEFENGGGVGSPVSSNNSDPFTIGGRAGALDAFSDMRLGEILIYEGVMADQQVQQVEGYLAWKWKLETQLPEDHPYRYQAPREEELWTPADMTTAAWYDTSAAFSITEAAGAVSQLDDLSGNGFHLTQPAGANQPTTDAEIIGGRNALSCDGNDFLQNLSVNITPTTDFAVFCVGELADPSNAFAGLASYRFTDLTGGSILCAGNPTPSNFMYAAGSRHPYGGSPGVVGTNPFLMSYIVTSNEATYRRDGGPDFTVANTITGQPLDIDRINMFTRADGNPTGRWLGKGGEVIMVADASEADKRRIEGYLAWKWGLEANLPVGHPYKLFAPGSVPAQPWTPDEIALGAWFDAKDGSTITQSALLVSQWDDKSGNGNHLTQGSGALQPTWNKSDGAMECVNGQKMTMGPGVNLLNANGRSSVFMVFEVIDPATSSKEVIKLFTNKSATSPGPLNRRPRVFLERTPDQLLLTNASSAGASIAASSFLGDRVLSLLVDPAGGGSDLIFVDGTQQAIFGTTFDGDTTHDSLKFGDLSDQNLLLKFKEIVLIADSLSVDDRQRMEGYLAWKHGLQDNLDASHPYSAQAPLI